MNGTDDRVAALRPGGDQNFCIASGGGVFDNQRVRRDLLKRTWRGGGPAGCLLAALFWWAGLEGHAAPETSPAETAAFISAEQRLQDEQYPQAESKFTNFLAVYTNSTYRPDAILGLAQSQLGQSNYSGAIHLLEGALAGAGMRQWDYVFCIATARFKAGDFKQAAEGFSNFAKHYANASQRLEAAYKEAEAHAWMGQWREVIALLQPADGIFRQAAAADPKGKFAVTGSLLLGEALLKERSYAEGEKEVGGIDTNGLASELRWRRQYLLCQIKLANGQAAEALNGSTNLLEAAFDKSRLAESVFLQGEILEKLDRLAEALQTYNRNLADTAGETQRQALGKIVQLTVALDAAAPAEAIRALEELKGRYPQASGLDIVELSLGELYLQAQVHPPKPGEGTNAAPLATNCLELAQSNFTLVILTNSPLAPKAYLDRGWCEWTQGKMGEAKSDFGEAARSLQYSEDQAVARFKLADAEFSAGDFGGAVGDYNLLLTQYDKLPAVTNGLFDLALFQLVEANINRGDTNGAAAAVGKILEWYPDSSFGARGLLLMGEDLDRKSNCDLARKAFGDLLEKAPTSPLAPEVKFAIARTYDHERNWPAAISGYTQWVSNYQGHPLWPEVEFSLGLAYDKAGMESNALMLFTNFIAQFSTNTLAAWAQNWVADYYYNLPDYPSAESNYELLFEKFGGVEQLSWPARLMAGKAALAHLAVEDARKYFLELVNGTNAPRPLVDQAYFALGETRFLQFQANTNNATYINEAFNALSVVTNGAPTNAIAVEAMGRMGEYWRYRAAINKANNSGYANAAALYEAIIRFPATNVSAAARGQAEFGLGVIAEKRNLTRQALDHYDNVLYLDQSDFVPYWGQYAGEAAARIYEDQQQWPEAVHIYNRLIEKVPALRPVLEKKIAAALSHEAAR